MVDSKPVVHINNGSDAIETPISEYLEQVVKFGAGELYLNSIDRDGTGQGYELDIFDHINHKLNIPIILSGGAGNYNHLIEGHSKPHVDAVATANLFNFVGSGIPTARKMMKESGIEMPEWNGEELQSLKNIF